MEKVVHKDVQLRNDGVIEVNWIYAKYRFIFNNYTIIKFLVTFLNFYKAVFYNLLTSEIIRNYCYCRKWYITVLFVIWKHEHNAHQQLFILFYAYFLHNFFPAISVLGCIFHYRSFLLVIGLYFVYHTNTCLFNNTSYY